MQLKSKTKGVVAILVFSLIASFTGCTKEKSEAIKTGAEQFRVEAKAAINQVRILNKQDALVLFTSTTQEAKSIASNFPLGSTNPQEVQRFVSVNISRNQRLGSPSTPLEENLSHMEQTYEL